MLSNSAKSNLKHWMKFCSATGVLPFSWSTSNSNNLGEGHVIISNSSRQWVGGLLIRGTLAIYSAYYIYHHYATLYNEDTEEQTNPSAATSTFLPFCWIAIYASGYFWALGSVTNFWKNQTAFSGHLNAILQIDEGLKIRLRTYDVKDSGLDLIKLLLLFMKLVLVGAFVALNGVHFVHPDRVQYLSSHLHSTVDVDGHSSFQYYVLLFIVDHATVTFAATFCFLDVTLLLFYIVCTSTTIGMLRKSKIPSSHKIDIYNQLILINRLQRSCSNVRIHQLIYCFQITTVLGNVGLICFHDDFSMFDFIAMIFFGHMMGVLHLGILHFFGTIPLGCTRLLESFRRRGRNNKLTRSRVKGLQIFGVECAPVRAIRLNSMFNSILGSTNMIVTCLVFLK